MCGDLTRWPCVPSSNVDIIHLGQTCGACVAMILDRPLGTPRSQAEPILYDAVICDVPHHACDFCRSWVSSSQYSIAADGYPPYKCGRARNTHEQEWLCVSQRTRYLASQVDPCDGADIPLDLVPAASSALPLPVQYSYSESAACFRCGQ